MKNNIKSTIVILITFTTVFAFTSLISSCKKILDVKEPNSKISATNVFSSNENANSAVVGMYLNMYSNAFAGGSEGSVPWITGLSADELHSNPQTDPIIIELEENEIQASNRYVAGLWTSMYKLIYQANSILNGLDSSTGITPEKKDQFRGEAMFIRAFAYFYLVNLFGNVPLALTTDYQLNTTLSRNPQTEVYATITDDLLAAENLLPQEYPTEGRVRPNQSVARALLARVYLYRQQWQKASDYASKIIASTSLYDLPSNLNSVFLAGSNEAIWQLKPNDSADFTGEGFAFLSTPQNGNVLKDSLVKSFSNIDKRKINWITTKGTLYVPYKYKLYLITGQPTSEYSMIFRLAEQYLIRAEARAQLGNISGSNSAVSDINTLRDRAGLLNAEASNFAEVMNVIEVERKLELFSEWGHRWFDLKRWNKATDVLGQQKSKWQVADTLYPVPESEINKNTNLMPQNIGY